ncbi:MAG TPA: hypothetical protein VHA13_03410, partial [Gammaproteobacteria bacterium]|nr:hypothetical protein [Gammaproteobacteria bacterium]
MSHDRGLSVKQMTPAALKSLRDDLAGFNKNKSVYLGVNLLRNELETLANLNFSDSERMQKAMDIFSSAYVDLYLDERKKATFGTEKGDNLKHMEALMEKYGMIMPALSTSKKDKNDKTDARILQAIAVSSSSADIAIDRLFSRAMTEGIGRNNEQLFANACKVVVRMGSQAVESWNNLIEQRLLAIPETARQQLKISTDIDKQNEKDFAQAYHTLIKRPDAVQAISSMFKLELLTNFIGETANRLNSVLADTKDQRDQEKRAYVIWGSTEFEKLHKNLIGIKKNNVEGKEDKIFEELMKTYLTIYAKDKGKGSWGTGKGQLLKDIENIIKQYQHQIGGGLLSKESKEDKELLNVVADNKLSPSLQRDIARHAYKLGLEYLFSQNKDKEQDRASYINVVKAVVAMGDEMVAEWNRLAANIKPNHPIAYPDLIINSTVNTETIGAAFDGLTQDPEFMKLRYDTLNRGSESKSDSSLYISESLLKSHHALWEPESTTVQNATPSSANLLSSSVSRSESPVRGNLEDEMKVEVKLDNSSRIKLTAIIGEFQGNQARFHADMKAFSDKASDAIEKLRQISPRHADWLAYYMEPYKDLSINPFANLTVKDEKGEFDVIGSIKAVQDTIGEISQDGSVKLQPAMQSTLGALKEATLNHEAFTKFAIELLGRPDVKADKDLKSFLEFPLGDGRTIGSHIVKPVQHGPRYNLTLIEAERNLPGPEKISFNQVREKISEELIAFNNSVMRVNDECYLIYTTEVPSGDPRQFFANICEQEFKKNPNTPFKAGDVQAAYIVTIANDQRKVHYFNVHKSTNIPLVEISNSSEIKKYDEILGKIAKLDGVTFPHIAKIKENELGAVEKLFDHKHAGGRQAMVEKRFNNFLLGDISNNDIQNIIKELDSYLQKNRVPALEALKKGL